MTRVVRERGTRGSLKWIQTAVSLHRELLEEPIRAAFPDVGVVQWLSPLEVDSFAEYRDGAFLERLGLAELKEPLRSFWPQRGPQWDALARSGDVRLLFEAKAHLREAFSAPTQAVDPQSLALIERSLGQVAEALGAEPIAPWHRAFYQYANRIAHLYFLREVAGVDARLVFVDFIGDVGMGGPDTSAMWQGAYATMDHVLGLRRGHRFTKFIAHVYPDTRLLDV